MKRCDDKTETIDKRPIASNKLLNSSKKILRIGGEQNSGIKKKIE